MLKACEHEGASVAGVRGIAAELPVRPLADWLTELASECGFDRHPVSVRRGRKVYRIGQWESSLYLVRQGLVATTAGGPGPRSVILDLFGANSVFGETCLSTRAPRSETAQVLRDAVLIRIPSAALLPRISDPEVTRILFSHLTQRVAEMNRHLAQLLTCNAEQRLALVLSKMARSTRLHEQGMDLTPPMTQQELAAAIGATRNRVCNFLRKFRELGWVRPGTDAAILVDVAALCAHACKPTHAAAVDPGEDAPDIEPVH